MNKIDIGKLEMFIMESKEKQMTNQEIANDMLRLKHSIVEQAEENLRFAFEEKNSTMVAAIAEILRNV